MNRPSGPPSSSCSSALLGNPAGICPVRPLSCGAALRLALAHLPRPSALSPAAVGTPARHDPAQQPGQHHTVPAAPLLSAQYSCPYSLHCITIQRGTKQSLFT